MVRTKDIEVAGLLLINSKQWAFLGQSRGFD